MLRFDSLYVHYNLVVVWATCFEQVFVMLPWEAPAELQHHYIWEKYIVKESAEVWSSMSLAGSFHLFGEQRQIKFFTNVMSSMAVSVDLDNFSNQLVGCHFNHLKDKTISLHFKMGFGKLMGAHEDSAENHMWF